MSRFITDQEAINARLVTPTKFPGYFRAQWADFTQGGRRHEAYFNQGLNIFQFVPRPLLVVAPDPDGETKP